MTNEYNEMCKKTIDGIDDSMEIPFRMTYSTIEEAFRGYCLFQDSEGKIPVTEVGQPVGLIKQTDGSTFFKANSTSESPTLQKREYGYCIMSENGQWI